MGHKKIGKFISERGLIGTQIPNGLCRVLSVVCQPISFVNAHLKKNWKSYVNLGRSSELQIKKNSCQTLGPASKRVLPDLLFFRNFLIFHFQYSMINGTILKP